jgi:hypothetical protein
MDKHSFNIRSGGWTGYKHGIASSLKSGITICLMEIAYDLLRIEQDKKMLGKIGQGIRCQFVLTEPNRPGLGDTERRPDDTDIHIGQRRWLRTTVDQPCAKGLRRGGADHLGVGEQ